MSANRYSQTSYRKRLDTTILCLNFAITRVNPPSFIRSPPKHSETWSFETSSNLIADTRRLAGDETRLRARCISNVNSQMSYVRLFHLSRSRNIPFVTIVSSSSNLYHFPPPPGVHPFYCLITYTHTMHSLPTLLLLIGALASPLAAIPTLGDLNLPLYNPNGPCDDGGPCGKDGLCRLGMPCHATYLNVCTLPPPSIPNPPN